MKKALNMLSFQALFFCFLTVGVYAEESSNIALAGKNISEEVEAVKKLYKDNRVWFVPKTEKAPVIDGKIEDIWKKSAAHRFTWQHFGKGSITVRPADWPEQPREATDAYLLCDKDNIYAAFVCFTADVKKLKGYNPPRKADEVNWSKHDLVEAIFDPGRTRTVAYQFASECFGTFSDVIFDPNKYATEKNTYGEEIPWSSKGVEWATGTGKDHYVVEMKIPFSTMGIETGKVSRYWGVNLCRQNPGFEDTAIAYTGRRASGRPAHFGTAIIEVGISEKKQ
jgi:hypothetical protein